MQLVYMGHTQVMTRLLEAVQIPPHINIWTLQHSGASLHDAASEMVCSSVILLCVALCVCVCLKINLQSAAI